MAFDTSTFFNQITNTDLEHLFKTKLKEMRNGQLQGLCPFHKEDTPSFYITKAPESILFHCFGCGAKGNLISHIASVIGKEPKGKDFFQILEYISKETGVLLPDDFYSREEYQPSPEEKNFQTYHNNLLQNTKALEHLKQRGVSDFSLFGYDNGVYKILYRSKYKTSIVDYVPDGKPKYKFEHGIKKDFPFNFNNVRGKTEVYLTEGIFDAISLYQNFKINSVAILGSDILKNTLDLLKPYSIVVALDNDEAGKKGTKNIIEKLYHHGIQNVFYVDYEKADFQYKDFNEAIQKGDYEAIKRCSSQETIKHGFKFVIETNFKTEAFDDKGNMEKIARAVPFISGLPVFIQKLAKHYFQEINFFSIDELVRIYQTSMSLADYKEQLKSLLKQSEDSEFTISTVREINELTRRVDSATALFDPYTIEAFKEELSVLPKGIKSKVLTDPDIQYQPGALSFIASRTGHGKTTFMINEATLLCNEHKVAFISLEEAQKFISAKLFVSWYNHRNRYNNEPLALKMFFQNHNNYNDSLARFFENIYIFDKPSEIEGLEKLILAIHEKLKVNFIFIDYIQRIYFNSNEKSKLTRQEQVKQINSILLDLAKDNDLYMVLGSQANRQVKSYDDIKSTTFYREAGDIEQDANLIFNLWNHRFDKEPNDEKISIYIAKNRDGKMGGEYELNINPERWMIKDCFPKIEKSFEKSDLDTSIPYREF
jgi:replicative DNA helicase/5S rRNA maturation endonuclease (ribonuclease M5)